MKTLFELGLEKEAGSDDTLLLEIGNGHLYTAILNRKTSVIEHLHMFSFDTLKEETEVATLITSVKKSSEAPVVICSAYPQALLFPHKYFKNDYTSLQLVYDQPLQNYFNDTIEEWQMVNAYAIPAAVAQPLMHAFPNARYLHCYTPAIRIYNGLVADHQLLVHINQQDFRVLLKKDMAICLAQTYSYQTPLDVVYYLLKISHAFGLSQETVYLVLSGMVERDSNLYAELQQYFTHLHFAQQPEIGLPQSSHPYYFFASIYNLAACVL